MRRHHRRRGWRALAERLPARSFMAGLVILAGGVVTLGWGTDGFRAYTLEAARRVAIEAEPRSVPAVLLEDQHGQAFTPDQLRGHYVVANFMYTRCPTLCSVAGTRLAGLRDAVRGASAADALLLSVSFDPRETQASLSEYARRYGAAAPRWRVTRVADAGARRLLLRTFGVVVVPDRLGGFVHNAAFYLIDREGRVVALFDLDATEALMAELRRRSG